MWRFTDRSDNPVCTVASYLEALRLIRYLRTTNPRVDEQLYVFGDDDERYALRDVLR